MKHIPQRDFTSGAVISCWQISIFRFDISISRTCRSGQHRSVIPVACNLTFCKNFERVVTNQNSRFATALHLSTSITLSEWTNGERPIIFLRSRVRALNMVVGKFSSPVSCLREKKRALEDLALTQADAGSRLRRRMAESLDE